MRPELSAGLLATKSGIAARLRGSGLLVPVTGVIEGTVGTDLTGEEVFDSRGGGVPYIGLICPDGVVAEERLDSLISGSIE